MEYIINTVEGSNAFYIDGIGGNFTLHIPHNPNAEESTIKNNQTNEVTIIKVIDDILMVQEAIILAITLIDNN